VKRARRGVDQLREFGDRVRAERKRAEISQEDLGEASGLHRTYIGHVERGEVNLSLVNVLKIAAALGVDAGVLVEGLSGGLGDPRLLEPIRRQQNSTA
jgi:transcriptional regulator with XRE-family HTH domain